MGIDAETIVGEMVDQNRNATQEDNEYAAKIALESAIDAANEAALQASDGSGSENSGQAGAEAGRPESADVEGLSAHTRGSRGAPRRVP
jgi:hypothetical protein